MRKLSTALFAVPVAVAVCGAASHSALAAAEQVGLAVVVKNNVSQVEPATAKILEGDDIVRDEVVQTQADSHAKFVLKDSTNLMLGPNSRLKLDKAVFAGEHGLGDVAIKLGVGSFRFMTGNLAKESYSITTPVATMGVRGTTLEFLNEIRKSTISLKDGQAEVCAGGRCVQLLKAGDTAIVTSNGQRTDIELQSFSTWSFACEGMCSPMSFAQAENALTTGSLGGGGGGGGGGVNNPPGPLGGFGSTQFSSSQGTPTGSIGLLGTPGLGSVGPSPVSDR